MLKTILDLGTVVTSDGDYVDIIAFDPDSKKIESYELKDGEVLIESVPEGFLKPFYNFVTKAWEEGATKEEIAEHKKALEEKQKRDEESKQKGPAITTAEIMLGMTSMYEEMLKKDTENKMALAEIYELELNK